MRNFDLKILGDEIYVGELLFHKGPLCPEYSAQLREAEKLAAYWKLLAAERKKLADMVDDLQGQLDDLAYRLDTDDD